MLRPWQFSQRRPLALLVMLVMLASCESLNLADTVAGGADGEVDYCVRALGVEALCVQARRTTPVADPSP